MPLLSQPFHASAATSARAQVVAGRMGGRCMPLWSQPVRASAATSARARVVAGRMGRRCREVETARSPRVGQACVVGTGAKSGTTGDYFDRHLTGPESSRRNCFEDFQGRVGDTPLVQLGETNIYAKLEGHNPSGSIKDRALSAILLAMIDEGRLSKQNDTLCLVTSGSAGVSLAQMHRALTQSAEFTLDMLIVMPEAYASKPVPAEIIAMESVTVFRSVSALMADGAAADKTTARQRVLLLDGAFVDVLAETKEVAAECGWKMLDQHHDDNGLTGHETTATEIMRSLPGVTDVICSTGTGATAAGLRAYLPEHVRVHARPGASGAIDGLSDVGRYNNFCDASTLNGYYECTFDRDHAVEHQEQLLKQYSIVAGPSTGATHWLATEINRIGTPVALPEQQQQQQQQQQQPPPPPPPQKIVFIAADGRLLPEARLDFEPLAHGQAVRICAGP